ncbi:ATP-binding protein [Streptomyces acidicola]|uniref:ATP-binding protein n=1 Tax=Streptomyces acidicola TaxID=2596892 RepID=UPI0034432C23
MDSAVEASEASAQALSGLPDWQAGPFVGRAAERADVRAALGRERLVTLTGPPGVGKTRLAAVVASEAAQEFPGGGGFAELMPVRPEFLAQAVATALGVTERPGQPLEQALQERLGQGRCLLVVDGCEHSSAAVTGLVGRLLDGCPHLVVLATGHEPLRISGEHVLQLGALPVTETSGSGAVRGAVELFLDRARGTGGDRRHAARVCAGWGGTPLAVELVAAGAGSPDAGLGERREAGEVGDTGEAERAIAWSYGRLNADERRVLRQLGVFLRGFDAAAAHALAAGAGSGDGSGTVVRAGSGTDTTETATLLDRLAARALLVRGRPDVGLWRMPPAVRALARERLVIEGEVAVCRARHLAWAVATATELEEAAAEGTHAGGSGRNWQARFDKVADDLRAALDGAGAHPAPEPHRLARALAHLCYARQFLVEARTHFRTAGALAPTPAAAAADLRAAADVAMTEHRGDLAYPLLREAAQHAAAAGDAAAQAVALSFAACIGSRFPATFTDLVPYEELRTLLEEARRLAPPGDRLVAAYLAAAEAWNATGQKTAPDAELAQVALDAARAAADPVLIAGAIDAVCGGYGVIGRFREAHRLSDERLRLFDRLPRHDPRIGLEIIDTLHVVPLAAVAAGDLPRALTAARRAWDDPLSGLYMRASKSVAPLALSGRFDEALHYAATMWDGWRRAGRPTARWMAPAVHAAALVHGLRGDVEGARLHREWHDRARRMAEPSDPRSIAASFAAFAEVRVALHTGAVDDALAAAVDITAAPWSQGTHQFYDAYSWAVAAEAAVCAGLPDAVERLAAAAPAGAENAWAAACLARAAGRLHGDRDALLESVAGWERIDAAFELACTLVLLPDRAAEGLAQLASSRCRPPTGLGRITP